MPTYRFRASFVIKSQVSLIILPIQVALEYPKSICRVQLDYSLSQLFAHTNMIRANLASIHGDIRFHKKEIKSLGLSFSNVYTAWLPE